VRDVQEIFTCTSSAYGECGPIVRCDACGFVYQNPQPDPDWIVEVYESVVDTRYDEEREGRVHTFRRSLTELSRHVSRGRLLDVGSHLGVFVEVAREAGWDAEGVEPSRWASDLARSRGIPTTQGAVADLERPEGSYDAVTLWDVIEHLADPAAELRHLHRLMRPGGILAVSTMDVDAAAARLLGRRWPWYMQMHLFYFSRRTLARLVEQTGFEVVETRRHRRIVRVSYLLSRLERGLGRLYPALSRALNASRVGRLLVTADVGDLITLFARKPTPDDPQARRNGHGAP
jgi:2-polyprenyl-3-methyl-5-hydroxy-6-metoxy-1,4-benzoquinol methylase